MRWAIGSTLCALFVAGAVATEIPKIASDAEHDAAYKKGTALIWPHISVLERPAPEKTESSRRDLREGIAYLDAVTQYNSKNWPAFWVKGKAFQMLGDAQAAYAALQSAYRLKPDHPDVAREYALSCLEVDRGEVAIEVTQHAIALRPTDAGLRANLALAYLMTGRDRDALQEITEAMRMDPNDGISRDLKSVIEDVLAGTRQQPHRIADVQNALGWLQR